MTAEHTAKARLILALTASVLLHGALLASIASPRLNPGGHRPRAALEVILPAPSLPAPAASTPQVALATALAAQPRQAPAIAKPQVALAALVAPTTVRPPAKSRSHAGELDSPPQPLLDITPEYPEGAFAQGLSGKVEVAVWVDETGRVENAMVVATTMADAFNRSALKAVHEMRFTPGMSGGKPVKSAIRAVIVYELQ